MNSKIIVGVCGLNASGKSSVCSVLATRGFVVMSLSDVIRAELGVRGVDETRENLRLVGNELRTTEGHGVLAERLARLIQSKDEQQFVIDSFRHPAEVSALRKGATEFTLVGVVTPQEKRYERLLARGRVGDATSFEEFKAAEDAELCGEGAEQQLLRVMEMADEVIENGGEKEAFERKIDEWIEKSK